MKKFFTLIGICCVLTLLIIIGVFAFGRAGRQSESAPKTVVVGLAVGNRAPDFTVTTIDGQIVALQDFKGKKALVVTTTASWCPTCIIEAENFAPVYPRFKDSAEFLSVSMDPTDDRLKLEAFRTNTNTPWFYTEPKLSGTREMIITYRFDRFEITYIIDKDGIIRFKDRQITSTETLQTELEKL